MSLRLPQRAPSNGLDLVLTATDQANGDTFVAAPGRALVVVNTTAGSINLTVETPSVVGGDLAVADRVVAIPGPANTRRYFANFEDHFVDPSTGRVRFTASAVGLTVGVVQA